MPAVPDASPATPAIAYAATASMPPGAPRAMPVLSAIVMPGKAALAAAAIRACAPGEGAKPLSVTASAPRVTDQVNGATAEGRTAEGVTTRPAGALATASASAANIAGLAASPLTDRLSPVSETAPSPSFASWPSP